MSSFWPKMFLKFPVIIIKRGTTDTVKINYGSDLFGFDQ